MCQYSHGSKFSLYLWLILTWSKASPISRTTLRRSIYLWLLKQSPGPTLVARTSSILAMRFQSDSLSNSKAGVGGITLRLLETTPSTLPKEILTRPRMLALHYLRDSKISERLSTLIPGKYFGQVVDPGRFDNVDIGLT